MSDFLINVRTIHDVAGVRAYLNEVRQAIRAIEAEASGVRGRPLTGPALQSRVQTTQASAFAGLEAVAASGVIPPAAVDRLRASLNTEFDRVSRVLGVQLAGAEEVVGQARRTNQSSAAAATAQEKADRVREERANREATRARAVASPEDRLARQTQTRQISQRAGVNARLLEAGLDPLGGEEAISAAKDRLALFEREDRARRRALIAALDDRLRSERGMVDLAAAELVSKREFAGRQAAALRGDPDALRALTGANVETRGLRDTVRGHTAVEEQALFEDRDPRRMAQHQVRIEELAVSAIRRAEESAAANRALLANENALTALTEARVAAEQRRLASRTPAELEAATRREASARERAARAVEKHAREAELQAVQGTGFQRFQQRLSARTGQEPRPAGSFPTLGQAVGTGFVTTARFAISGAALYGALNTVQEMVREASELERIFNQVDAQFASLGQSGEAQGFREQLLEISKETGQMADEVALVGLQMKGAFGDTASAVDATRAAIQIARISGLDLTEVVDSLTAASKSFQVPLRSIGDEALAVQERFGVLAKESIKIFGDVGVVAEQAGLDIHELGGIIGGLQQISGRGGAALGEAINRILPAIQESSTEILSLYQQVPALAANFPKIRDLLGQGQYGDVLIQLTRDFASLDKTQQAYIISQLGSRREAQTLIGVLRQHGVVLDYIDNQTATAGKTTDAYNKLQETLAQRTARLAREFEAFGQRLFNAGLGDVLKDIVSAAASVVSVAADIAGAFAAANEATHGLALRMLELYAVYKSFVYLQGLAGVAGLTGVRGVLGAGATRAAAVPGALQGVAANAAGRYAVASIGAQAAGGYFGTQIGAAGTALGGARAAASGGLAAIGLTGPMLAAIAAIAVGSAYQGEKKGNDKVADRFRESIENATEERLNKIIDDRGSTMDQIEEGVLRAFHFRTPISEAKAERGQDRYAQIQQRAEAGRKLIDRRVMAGESFLGGPGKESIDDLYKKAAEGDERAIKHIEKELAEIDRDPKKRAQLDANLAAIQAKVARDEEEKRVVTGEALDTVKELQDKYEAGLATVGEYADALAREIRNMEAQLPGLTGDKRQAVEEQLAELRKSARDLPSTLARGAADYRISELDATGGSPEEKLRVLAELLRNPQLTNPSDRKAVADQMAQIEQAMFDAYVSQADTAEEELRRLTEGLERSPEARVEQLLQAVSAYDINFTNYARTVAGGAEQAAVLLRLAAERAVEKGISITQGLNEVLAEQQAALAAKLNSLATTLAGLGIGEFLSSLSNAVAAGPAPAAPTSIIDTPGSRLRGDATQIQSAREKAAREAKARAEEAAREAEATRRAQANLNAVRAEGDPVAVAQAQLAAAQDDLRAAKTQADKLNAQAAVIQAQRALSRAHVEVADAYRGIDKAMAEATGDTVRSAQIELESIRAHLENARARGDKLGEAQAMAQLIAQQRAVDQETLSTAQQDIDFYRQMGQATLGQTIAAYEALLPLAAKNKDDYQALLLKINALRKEGEQNTAFNIPTGVTLPTLYEVRRANQVASVGSSYQDNRVITVNFQANNVADAQAIATDIVDRFSAPSRVGTLPRRY